MPAQLDSRSRGWVFTINNPVDEDDNEIARLATIADYVTFGKETGAQGTPHYQGFCIFKHPQRFQRVKALLTRAHLEVQRGSLSQAISYCHKDGDYVEHGERPGTNRTTKEQWAFCIAAAESGDMEAIKSEYPGLYVRYLERWQSLRIRDTRPLDGDLTHEWWVGPTGTGKSRTLWEMYPDHYAKELNKWWDGYTDQDVVAIEEWCPKNECTASFLKIWADRYPFPAQIKGGSLKKIRPKKLIVLSNYTIEQCFPQVEDYEPIQRRFTVKHFFSF